MSTSIFRQKKDHPTPEGNNLKRVLSMRDLTALGIAAIIGAGSFSSLGDACFKGGPGVVILFLITGIACTFTALCYAEFAARIPASGSAYTYAYASFGEVIAWIIGWALLMEYSIGNIYVAFSWSDYFTSLLTKIGIHFPEYLSCSYLEAQKAFLAHSTNQDLIKAWTDAPVLGGLKIILDLPAFAINIFVTYLVYIGVKESKNFSNLMVLLKLFVVLLVIVVGAFYIDPNNWFPAVQGGTTGSFMPNGFTGVMAAVSGVFFAYIGFDAVSTFAEESKNPQRDLPRGMFYSLAICTVVYILLTLVLTGTVDYRKFEGVGDPLAKIFEIHNIGWMQFLVAICAVIAMTSVLLVFQMGQPRIWMSMSRDGLIPPAFQKIHQKYQTPSFATIVTGLVVGIPIFFTDKTFVLDFTSIATLFAFVLVCGGVLMLPKREKQEGRFYLTYVNGKYIFPILVLLSGLFVQFQWPNYFTDLINIQDSNATFQISTLIFWAIILILGLLTFIKNYSLIPLLGLVTCLYLLTGMTATNWAFFAAWLSLGLLVYFGYSYRKSNLHKK
jgi:APA family basic amino acid/polyamine antiporter